MLLRHTGPEKQAAGGLWAAPLWHVPSCESSLPSVTTSFKPKQLWAGGAEWVTMDCCSTGASPPPAARLSTLGQTDHPHPAAPSRDAPGCLLPEAMACPAYTHWVPWFVSEGKAEERSHLGWCCSARVGCALRALSSWGVSDIPLIEWVRWSME